jgi:hypothetical protein
MKMYRNCGINMLKLQLNTLKLHSKIISNTSILSLITYINKLHRKTVINLIRIHI